MLFKKYKMKDEIVLKRFKKFDEYYCKNCPHFLIRINDCKYRRYYSITNFCEKVYKWLLDNNNLFQYVYYPINN